MTFAGVVTIIGALLTVLALASYLIYVALVLRRVDSRLRAVTAGLVSINEKAGPITPVLLEINKDLAGVDDALRAVLTKDRQPKGAPPPSSAQSELPAPWVVVPRGKTPRS